MSAPRTAPRQQYLEWVEDQLEEYKSTLTRDELLDVAEEAVRHLQAGPDGQYALTELLLCDAVDRLLFERLGLPDFRRWRKACRSDTADRPAEGTEATLRAAS